MSILLASVLAIAQAVGFTYAVEPMFRSFGDVIGTAYIVLALASVGLSWFGIQHFVERFTKG